MDIPEDYEILKKEVSRLKVYANNALADKCMNDGHLQRLTLENHALKNELKSQRIATNAFCDRFDNIKSNCDRLEIDSYLRISIDCLCIAKTEGREIINDNGCIMPIGAIGIIREVHFCSVIVEWENKTFFYNYADIRIIHEITTYKKDKYFTLED